MIDPYIISIVYQFSIFRLSDENRKLSQQLQKHKDITNGKDNTENLQKELSQLRAQHDETLNR